MNIYIYIYKGMYGKSWGGFNGLQTAFLQPPALKAVISLYSTDNRYTDDVHCVGGEQRVKHPDYLTHIHIYIYLYIYICKFTYMNIYIYINIHI